MPPGSGAPSQAIHLIAPNGLKRPALRHRSNRTSTPSYPPATASRKSRALLIPTRICDCASEFDQASVFCKKCTLILLHASSVSFTSMRYSVAALLFPLALSTSCLASVNFSGIWTLDLKASDSPDPMMKRIRVPLIHRNLPPSPKLAHTSPQPDKLL